ncbi:MAG: hypothetical protein RI962_850 [Pseudomonadota bacterium]|jgi:hypothetical protein
MKQNVNGVTASQTILNLLGAGRSQEIVFMIDVFSMGREQANEDS